MKIVIREESSFNLAPSLNRFLGISPLTPHAKDLAHAQLQGRHYPREQLARLLMEYNREIGNDSLALDNISQLRQANTFCVVTGQQVGLMGGPSYTIFKAISCLHLARQSGAIPLFWAATEDHDTGEIDHATLLNAKGNLERFHLSFPRDGRFVEDLVLTESHIREIHSFCQAAGLDSIPGNPTLKAGDLYSRAMVRLLVGLFAGTGLVFLEPYLLRQLAVPFFEKEISQSAHFQQVLKGTTERLLASGGEAPLLVGEGTNLFFKSESGRRMKILSVEGGFQIGEQTYPEAALLQLIQSDPSKISCNASARVALQNTLFPVLAYVAGPTEMSYHCQLLDYHHAHGIPMPWIVPRLSATFLSKEAAGYLNRLRLNPWDPIPDRWEDGPPVGVPSHAIHLLRNLIHPRQRSQERVLNWFGFQAKASENLMQGLLGQTNCLFPGHYYCFFE